MPRSRDAWGIHQTAIARQGPSATLFFGRGYFVQGLACTRGLFSAAGRPAKGASLCSFERNPRSDLGIQ